MRLNDEQKRVLEVFTTKPKWMKNAVLTRRGWANPETGELLLGRRTPDWVFEALESNEISDDVVKDKLEEVVEEVKADETPVEVKEEAEDDILESDIKIDVVEDQSQVEETPVEEVKVEEVKVEEVKVESKPAARKSTRKPKAATKKV